MLLAVAALAVVLVGCGGGGSDGVAQAVDATTDRSDTASTVPAAAEDAEQAQLDFAKCMREQGIDFPDPQPDENGNLRFQMRDGTASGDREEMMEAMGECRQYLEAARPEMSAEERQEREDQQLEFAKCMREEGIDMPDPSGDGGPPSGMRDLDMDDPATAAAMEKCQEEVGGFGGPGGGPPMGSGGAGRGAGNGGSGS